MSKSKRTIEKTWQDYQDIRFWPWVCVEDGQELLREFEAFDNTMAELIKLHFPERYDPIEFALRVLIHHSSHEDAQWKRRRAEYRFILAVGQVYNTYNYLGKHDPEVQNAFDNAPHIKAEGNSIRNMIEHV